jgi:hypothetical protein
MNHDPALTTINRRLYQRYPRIPAVRGNAIPPFWRGYAARTYRKAGTDERALQTLVGQFRNGIGVGDGKDECWRDDRILRY